MTKDTSQDEQILLQAAICDNDEKGCDSPIARQQRYSMEVES